MDLKAKDRIIVALDLDDHVTIDKHIVELREHVGMFKLGLEAIHALGTSFVKAVAEHLDVRVFIDCKLHDIPETMRKSARQVVGHNILFYNVHASAGEKGIKAAAEAKGESKLLAVTLLTSHSADDVAQIYNADHVERKVVSLAVMAMRSGADGIICSPKEIKALRENPATKNALLVTPGVRPTWAAANDQKRVLTPKEAIADGADYLVIGRPILQPPEGIPSRMAADMIADEIAEALAAKAVP